jgi:hypothetical protein
MPIEKRPTADDMNRVRAVILAIPDELTKNLPESERAAVKKVMLEQLSTMISDNESLLRLASILSGGKQA